MSDTPIPKSPTSRDYTANPTYAAQAEANATPIFERDDPFALFAEWMAEARKVELNDSNAMSLATVDDAGMPDVRMVLLKGADARGFVFYTNSESAKGQQLASVPKAALCLHWKSLRRQVRVRGEITRVSDAEADAYFTSRARGSQIGAWGSDQSRVAENRETLERKVQAAEKRFEGKDVMRPPHWYGYRVVPSAIEFWRDRPFRLHDRLLFTRDSVESDWITQRLFP